MSANKFVCMTGDFNIIKKIFDYYYYLGNNKISNSIHAMRCRIQIHLNVSIRIRIQVSDGSEPVKPQIFNETKQKYKIGDIENWIDIHIIWMEQHPSIHAAMTTTTTQQRRAEKKTNDIKKWRYQAILAIVRYVNDVVAVVVSSFIMRSYLKSSFYRAFDLHSFVRANECESVKIFVFVCWK